MSLNDRLGEIFGQYKTAEAAYEAAKQQLDRDGMAAAESTIAQLREQVCQISKESLGVEIAPTRAKAIMYAASRGATPYQLSLIAAAKRTTIGAKGGIVLPHGKYDHCSRGRGWARLGRGQSAKWGKKDDGGYRVETPGKWVVGSHDGFSRRHEQVWVVDLICGVWIAE